MCSLSVLENQIRNLKENYIQLCSTSLKRRESMELLDNVQLLLDSEKILGYLLTSSEKIYSYELLLKHSSVVAVKEFMENRCCKTLRSFRQKGFNALRRILVFYYDQDSVRRLSKNIIIDILETLLKMLRYPMEVRQCLEVIPFCVDVAAETVELLCRILDCQTILDIKGHQLKHLWNEIVALFDSLLDSKQQPAIQRMCTSIMLEIVRVSHCTVYIFCPEEFFFKIIEPLKKSFRKGHYDRDETCTNLLMITKTLIEEFGVENRIAAVEQFSPLIRTVTVENASLWTKDALVWHDQLFPDKKSGIFLHQATLFTLIDNFLVLCCPDCAMNFILYPELVKCIAKLITDSTTIYCSEYCAPGKTAYRKNSVLIEKEALGLIGRCFALCHLLPEDAHVKKSRTNPLLAVILDNSNAVSFQVFEATLRNWKHRFDVQYKSFLATELLNAISNKQSEELFPWYLRCCFVVCDEDVVATLNMEVCAVLWKIAISCLHTPSTTEIAAQVLSLTVTSCSKVLNLNDSSLVELLSDSISRLEVLSKSVVELLAVVMSHFEFNEQTKFRVNELKYALEWRYRCEVIEFIFDKADVSIIPVKALAEICQYIPEYEFTDYALQEVRFLEKSLMDLLCIQKRINRSDKAKKCKYCVTELMACLCTHITRLWKNAEEILSPSQRALRQVQIWRFINLLYHEFYSDSFNEEFANFLLINKSYSHHIVKLISDESLSSVLLNAMDIGNAWSTVDEIVKQSVCTLPLSSLEICKYSMYFGRLIDEGILKKIFKERITGSCLQQYAGYALQFCQNNDSLYQIITVIEQFGPFLTSAQRAEFLALLDSLAKDSKSDSFATTDENESMVIKRLTANFILKFFPEDELIQHKNITCNGSQLLVVMRATRKWLSEKELMILLMSETMNNENRAHLIWYILSCPLLHNIYLPTLAYLVTYGSTALYQLVKTVFPELDEVIRLYATNLSEYFIRMSMALPSGLLPTKLFHDLQEEMNLQKNVESFTTVLSGRYECLSLCHVKYLFLEDGKMLKNLFNDSVFINSVWKLLYESSCWFFVALHDLQYSCKSFNYTPVVMQSIRLMLSSYGLCYEHLPSISKTLKRFIVKNIVSLSCSSIRSFYERTKNVENLLETWLEIFELLLMFDEESAKSECLIVFENFIELDSFKMKIDSSTFIWEIVNSQFHGRFREILNQPVLPSSLLTKRFWNTFYEALLNKEEPLLNESEVQRLIFIWARYKCLRMPLAKVMALSNCKGKSAIFPYSEVTCPLDLFIFVSLLEMFLNPFDILPPDVYASVCEVLSVDELKDQANGLGLTSFFESTNSFTINYGFNLCNNFLTKSISGLLSGNDSIKRHILILSSNDEVFGALLLPYLVELAFNTNSDALQFFCTDVNHLLKKQDLGVLKDGLPLITSIVSCIRRLQVNIGSSEFQKSFPINLIELSLHCLKVELIDESYFFFRSYLDAQIDNIRPFVHLFSKEIGLFQLQQSSNPSVDIESHFQKILIALRDADTLRAFSLQSTVSLDSRLVLAESDCNWQHLSFLANTAKNLYLYSRALFYCGASLDLLEPCMQYRAAAELGHWDSLSFPKRKDRLTSGQRFYFLTFTRYRRQFEICKKAALDFVSYGASALCKLCVVKQNILKDLKEACEFEWLTRNDKQLPSEVQLKYGWFLSGLPGNSDIFMKSASKLITHHAQALLLKKAYQPALRLIENFRTRFNVSFQDVLECDLEKARILQKCHESEAARNILLRLVANKDAENLCNIDSIECYLKAYSMLASFEMCACRPDLAVNHLQKAIEYAVPNMRNVQNIWLEKVYRSLASYSERQYLYLEEYKFSNAYETKKNVLQEWDIELQRIEKKRRNKSPISKAKLIEERRIKVEKVFEENDLKQFELDYFRHISVALRSYLHCLELGVHSEDIPYRILPILVSMKNNKAIISIVSDNLQRISISHWIPLINHLCSHLFDDAPLRMLVYDILEAALAEYPFHVMNSLLFYVSEVNSAEKPDILVRKGMVEDLIKQVSIKKKSLSELLKLLQRAFNLYCEFAETDVSCYTQIAPGKKKYIMNDDSVLIKNIGLLRTVPLPAVSQRLTSDVGEMITFASIEQQITVADGLSKPLVVTIVGSDGIRRKLIFKREDLRDDSLVEQLFSVVNILLKKKNKEVCLRTYHVVPLNESAGIIEWCLDTMSLCEYLCGFNRRSGAHLKYYPDDLTAAEARYILSKAREENIDLCKEFEGICAKIHPVFRHFFYERFFDPLEWRNRIRDYSVSLAQWSIVGYVVGLGDRHLNNILIDLQSAQLVHIDLGMVFEFGKRNLPIPERVPFRLTRDTVDPILIEGINGLFKNSAVEVMDQLRNNSQVLIGLALVLLNDPLCTFGDSKKGNNFSSLAICRLRNKLAGVENRIFMTAEQQVLSLIKDAVDPENLARMFVGWMPFL